MHYGIQMEEKARDAYTRQIKIQHKNVQVSPCGLFVMAGKAYMDVSPDGLVEGDCCGQGLVEIKCPLTSAHTVPGPSNLPYLKSDDKAKIHLSRSHLYYSQVQHQIGVTGRSFFVYSRHGSILERMNQDKDRWAELSDASKYFFRKHVPPYMIANK